MNCFRRELIAASLSCLIASGAAAQQAATVDDDARGFIVRLSSEIILLLAAESSATARQEGVAAPLREAFDLELMGRTTLGDHWDRVTPEQRRDYQALFAEFVVQAYARQLAKHDQHSFSIVSNDVVPNGDVIVRELVERTDRPPLQLEFRVRATTGTNKIIDVTSDGVSLVLTQRSDFTTFLEDKGMDALIDALRTKLAKLE